MQMSQGTFSHIVALIIHTLQILTNVAIILVNRTAATWRALTAAGAGKDTSYLRTNTLV